jgi:hypothetical protein
LRKKLGIDIIQTMRGLGYRVTPPAAEAVSHSALSGG